MSLCVTANASPALFDLYKDDFYNNIYCRPRASYHNESVCYRQSFSGLFYLYKDDFYSILYCRPRAPYHNESVCYRQSFSGLFDLGQLDVEYMDAAIEIWHPVNKQQVAMNQVQ
jgi:hypothetical protein